MFIRLMSIIRSSTFFLYGKKVAMIKIITLNPDYQLAQSCAQLLKSELLIPTQYLFADGEMVFVPTDLAVVHDKTVVFIIPTSFPVHDAIIKIALLVDGAKKQGAKKVIGIIPYFGYARQHTGIHDQPGGVQVIIKMLEAAGIDHFITVALHDSSIESFFKVPVINIEPIDLIAQTIKKEIPNFAQYCIIAPDSGAHERAAQVAHQLGIELITCTKNRAHDQHVDISCDTKSSKAKKGIIIDDIISTGTTAIQTYHSLKAHNIEASMALFIHPVFAGHSLEDILHYGPFEKILVSNSIFWPTKANYAKLKVFDLSHAVVNALQSVLEE
jgi:ribose-phosphate pyrophosphokinase